MAEKTLASGNSWALMEEIVDFGLTRTVLKLRSKYGTVELSTKGQGIVSDILNNIKAEHERLKAQGPLQPSAESEAASC